MNCMKCGRETREQEIFCQQCLKKMAEFPVKPGTPVNIPKRPRRVSAPVVKKQKPEEIVELLEKKIRSLRILAGVLSLLLVVSIGLLVWHYATVQHGGFAIGQNYSTEAPGSNP